MFAQRSEKPSEAESTSGNCNPGGCALSLAEQPSEIEGRQEDEASVWRATAAEALRLEALDNLPNDLARLFFLASLFDPSTGRYVDYSRAERFGAEPTHRAASRSHMNVFRRLAGLPLEDLAKLVLAWADAESEGFVAVADEWRANQTYRLLTPPTAEQKASQAFENNIRQAIESVARKVRERPRNKTRRNELVRKTGEAVATPRPTTRATGRGEITRTDFETARSRLPSLTP
jgi:hypothetical protein